MIPDHPSFTEFAELVGVSAQAVSDLAARGVVAAGQSAQAMIRSYAVHLRAVAAGRAASGDHADLVVERAGLARAQRERTELQTRELRGELVRKAAVERALAGRLVALRESLDALGDRIGPVVAAERDALACRRILRDEIRQALAAFARADDGGGERDLGDAAHDAAS